MIGNDVIDLKLAAVESNWQRKGFLNKIFTDSEQNSILNSNNPFQTIWLLWSMKESAYKVYVQQYPQRFFNPKKLDCSLNGKSDGTVIINGDQYSTKTKRTKDCIHTVATQSGSKIYKEYFKFSKTDVVARRIECYQKLLLQFSRLKRIPLKSLDIRKNEFRIPKIYQNDNVLENTVSISHHGKYGAFAILN